MSFWWCRSAGSGPPEPFGGPVIPFSPQRMATAYPPADCLLETREWVPHNPFTPLRHALPSSEIGSSLTLPLDQLPGGRSLGVHLPSVHRAAQRGKEAASDWERALREGAPLKSLDSRGHPWNAPAPSECAPFCEGSHGHPQGRPFAPGGAWCLSPPRSWMRQPTNQIPRATCWNI